MYILTIQYWEFNHTRDLCCWPLWDKIFPVVQIIIHDFGCYWLFVLKWYNIKSWYIFTYLYFIFKQYVPRIYMGKLGTNYGLNFKRRWFCKHVNYIVQNCWFFASSQSPNLLACTLPHETSYHCSAYSVAYYPRPVELPQLPFSCLIYSTKMKAGLVFCPFLLYW